MWFFPFFLHYFTFYMYNAIRTFSLNWYGLSLFFMHFMDYHELIWTFGIVPDTSFFFHSFFQTYICNTNTNNIKHTNPNIITIWLFCEWKCYKNVLLWFWLDKSFEIIHHKQFDRPPTGMGNCAGSSCGEFVSQKDEESLRKIHRSRDLCQKKLQDCTKTLTTTWCFPSKKSEE